MYDAINDSRVRPAHLALDGIIRPKDSPFWAIHSPPCGFRCRCSLISLTDKQARDRSVNGKGLNQQPVLENGLPANPDKGWDYDKTNRMAGIEKAIGEKPQGLLKSTLEKRLTEKSTMIDKQGFADFVEKVTVEGYKARHEFIKVGELPDFVMIDSEVMALTPPNNEIHVSDHELRHANRELKSAPLPLEIVKQLPDKLENARWFYDSSHKNIVAFFDIGESADIGKAVVVINFSRKKKIEAKNSIVTSGIIADFTIGMDVYRELKQ
jgi:hypothetical protein